MVLDWLNAQDGSGIFGLTGILTHDEVNEIRPAVGGYRGIPAGVRLA
jgi:hypothetical protein